MNVEKRKRKSGWRYRTRFSLNSTPFASPWYKTTQEAIDWEITKRSELKAGQANTGADMRLETFAEIWLEKHAFANKVHSAAIRDRHALNLVLPTLGTTKLRNLTTVQIEFLFSDLKRAGKLRPKTLNNYLGTVKKMLNDAVRWNYLGFNPAKPVPLVKVPKQDVTILFADEIQRLLAFAREQYPEEHSLIVFALNTGCRLGECMGLEWTKVNLETRLAKVDSTYDAGLKEVVLRTKGKRFRDVPLNDDVLAILRPMILEGRRQENRLIFSRIKYEYFSSGGNFTSILAKAGLHEALKRKATFHSTRHTFASEFMRTGGNLFDLQHILGHSTIQQTERYAHFAPSSLAGATQRVTFSAPGGRVIVLATGKA